MSTNAERLRKYKADMTNAGFRRLSFYACPKLQKFLDAKHEPSECLGRTLERLLLGKAAKRPEYWTAAERRQREARRAENKARWV